jgi:23S rRNA pseudoU1915 N3-methylase RlmH
VYADRLPKPTRLTPDQIKERDRRKHSREIAGLKDSYIRMLLGMTARKATTQLIELKREQIRLHRLAKKMTQASKQGKNQ